MGAVLPLSCGRTAVAHPGHDRGDRHRDRAEVPHFVENADRPVPGTKAARIHRRYDARRPRGRFLEGHVQVAAERRVRSGFLLPLAVVRKVLRRETHRRGPAETWRLRRYLLEASAYKDCVLDNSH